MYRSNHESIKFAKGYNKPFAEFEKEFANVECFKVIPHKKRKNAMKKVHKRVLAETKQFAEAEAKAIEEQKELDKQAEKNAKDELSDSTDDGKKADAK